MRRQAFTSGMPMRVARAALAIATLALTQACGPGPASKPTTMPPSGRGPFVEDDPPIDPYTSLVLQVRPAATREDRFRLVAVVQGQDGWEHTTDLGWFRGDVESEIAGPGELLRVLIVGPEGGQRVRLVPTETGLEARRRPVRPGEEAPPEEVITHIPIPEGRTIEPGEVEFVSEPGEEPGAGGFEPEETEPVPGESSDGTSDGAPEPRRSRP